MQRLRSYAVVLLTASFLALALAQPESGVSLVTGAAVVALGVLLAARIVVGVAGAQELMVGARSREHREVLGALPEPQHPDTAGRPRSRAPAWVVSATPLPVV